MTLCDTGPLIALSNKSDDNYARFRNLLDLLPTPLVTTWPCFTEAMYMVTRGGHQDRRRQLWRYVEGGFLTIHETAAHEIPRMLELMEQYQDRPMDLADASIVAAAEARNQRLVPSIDSDFHIYRLSDGSFLDVIPGPA